MYFNIFYLNLDLCTFIISFLFNAINIMKDSGQDKKKKKTSEVEFYRTRVIIKKKKISK